jgi:diguanylate cyclase (GGDEF)-like protein
MNLHPDRFVLHPSLHTAGWAVAIAAAWVLSGQIGLEVATGTLRISLLWLPAGVLVAAAYRIGMLPAFFGGVLGSTITNAQAFGLHSPIVALISASQVAGPLLIAAALRRSAFNSRFGSHRDVLLFCITSLIGMLIPATGGVFACSVIAPAPIDNTIILWLSWWLGDSLGVLIAAPLLFATDRQSLPDLRPHAREFSVWLIAVIAVSFSHVIIQSDLHQIQLPLAFLGAPLALWAAMRFGPFGSSLAPFVVALAAASSTELGRGPFSEGPATANAIALLWSYITMITTISLIARALQAERARTKAELYRSDALLAGICEVQNDFILGQDTTRVFHQLLQTVRMLTNSQGSFLAQVHAIDREPAFHMVTITGRPFDSPETPDSASSQAPQPFQRYPELQTLAIRAVREVRAQFTTTLPDSTLQGTNGCPDAVIVPIRLRDQIIGVLGLARHQRPYSQDDIRSVDSILATCAAIMDGDANRRAREKAEQLASELAHFDPLTGLPNRRLLLARMQETLTFVHRTTRYGACFFIDIDDFKVINDTLGHQTGDELLVQVARRMREVVPDAATVARFAGDEFVILLPSLAGTMAAAEQAAQAHARALLMVIRQPFQIGGAVRHASASIGGCMLTPETTSIDELMQNADAAMYGAKQAGRNNVQFFDPATLDYAQRQGHLQLDLHDALQSGGIKFHAQPVVNQARQLVSLELLARWEHPRLGHVNPQDFIRVAEQSGLIQQLGMAALETAMTILQDTPNDRFSVAVNVSVLQLQNREFVDFVFQALRRRGIPPARLTLEITESHWLESSPNVVLAIETLHAHGVCLMLDDFGTGYSSFSCLRSIPLSGIKIDRAFVRRLGDSTVDDMIAVSIVRMAHSLGLSVTAEGVETDAQFSLLRAIGCDAFQGWLLARPAPLSELRAHFFDDSVPVLNERPAAETLR